MTPGIDTHTYEAVNTGKVDSKFGFPIETGAGEFITGEALERENLKPEVPEFNVGDTVRISYEEKVEGGISAATAIAEGLAE